MEFREVLRRRRMVRRYTDEPLHPAVVERVLDAVLRAPSERRRRRADVVHRGHW